MSDFDPPCGSLLIVSPHIDDAALSCAALLERHEPVDVLNVFTGRPTVPVRGEWDVVTGFSDSDAGLSTRLREDEAAFRGTAHRVAHLDILEDQYSSKPRPARDRATIVDAVTEWARESDRAFVAAPAGAGRRAGIARRLLTTALRKPVGWPPHPDHVLVRNAVVEAFRNSAAFVLLLYEELPYALSGSADAEINSLTKVLRRRAVLHEARVDPRRKALRLAAYSSQTPHLIIGGARLDDPALVPTAERYWYIEP